MPTYEYHCDSCERNFDFVQSFHDDPLTDCPTCGSPVRKVFGNVGIVFKGSGFYKTDSRNGSSGKASESTEVASAPSDSERSDSERSAPAVETPSSTPSDTTAKPSAPSPTSSPDKPSSDKSSSDKAKSSTGGKTSGAGTPAP